MILHKEKITNSMTLSMLKTDKFKTSVLSLTMTLPLNKKHYAYTTLLPGLLSRGTKSYPTAKELNKKLNELYGAYVEVKHPRIGENISLTINAEILDNKFITDGTDILGEVINVITEIILAPAFIESDFNQAFFEQEKKIACETIDSEISNSRLYASKRCDEIIYDSIELPTSQELKALISETTIESLIEYRDYFVNNAPMHIYYVGPQDESVVKEKILSSLSAYPCKEPIKFTAPRPIYRDNALELSTKMPVSQGKLSMGFSTGVVLTKNTYSFYTAIMLNEILGGSPMSKLFMNVREKLGICYYCSSSFRGASGIIRIASGFEVKNYDIAYKAILEQIEEIKRGNISDAELYAARLALTNNYRQIYDSPVEMLSFFRNRALVGINGDIEASIADVLSITKEDIIKLAQNIKLIASYFVEGTLLANNDDEENDDDE